MKNLVSIFAAKANNQGDKVDVKAKYQSRVKTAIVVFIIGIIVAMTSFQSLNFAVKLVLVLGVTFLIFKDDYSRVKNYYSVHLHDINLKLPYYLITLDFLVLISLFKIIMFYLKD